MGEPTEARREATTLSSPITRGFGSVCLGTNPPGRSAPRSTTHPKHRSKRIPQLFYEEARFQQPTRLSTGEQNIQFLIGGLVRCCSAFSCPHLAQTDTPRSTVFLKWASGMLSRSARRCLRRVPIIWGWGRSTNIGCQQSPERPGTPAARPRTQASLGQEAEGLTRLVCLVWVSGRKELNKQILRKPSSIFRLCY